MAYACPCGPRDIIADGEDGFLVTVNDEAALADRICCLIDDKALRQQMGSAAKRNVQRYRLDNVVALWLELFATLGDTKKQHKQKYE